MTRSDQSEREHFDDTPLDESAQSAPPTWQLAVPLIVTLAALAALVMFVYGFCSTRAR